MCSPLVALELMDVVVWEGEHLLLREASAFLSRKGVLGEMMRYLQSHHRSLMLSQSLVIPVEPLASVVC